jgi:murein DD-endopeptidase MepM/ murein hydrolase activator NlpD
LIRAYRFILPAILVASVIAFALAIYEDNHEIIQEAQTDQEPASEQIPIAEIYTGQLYKNSSLYTELLKQEVPETAVATITKRFSELFDLTNSHPGDEFKLFMSPGDTVVAFEYVTHDLKRYRLEKDGDRYIDKVTEVDLERREEFVGAVIETNLWDALIKQLPEADLFTKITDIYAWEIDFLTESRLGDKFKMVYEAFYKDGKFVKTGDILAAEYDLCGTPHRAFLYIDQQGYSDYYDENGYSLRRALLKSPLNYRRISSRYTQSRLHPVLKIYRPHLGVDYAAAVGTPVVAAGDGIIKVMDWVNGFGNYIEIEHECGLVTGYGHLNEFAKGIAKGRRVRQGQVIGYVGQTGVASGPHLDYRVKRDGHYINPLKMTIPASPPVKPEYLAEFASVVTERENELEQRVDSKLYVMNQQ